MTSLRSQRKLVVGLGTRPGTLDSQNTAGPGLVFGIFLVALTFVGLGFCVSRKRERHRVISDFPELTVPTIGLGGCPRVGGRGRDKSRG